MKFAGTANSKHSMFKCLRKPHIHVKVKINITIEKHGRFIYPIINCCRPKTDAIPLGQTVSSHIMCLKCSLKDRTICLHLAYFQPKNKTEK